MKLLFALLFLSLPFAALAKPGETYVLTGREKSIFGIFQADLKAYPELYEGVDVNAYYRAFKDANNLDNRKLKIGEELTFPHTPASQKAADERAEAASTAAPTNDTSYALNAEPAPELTEDERLAAEEKQRVRVRQEGVLYYQTSVLPHWVFEQGNTLWSRLERGDTSVLVQQAEQCVDETFAGAMKFHAYPAKKLYVIEFETPKRGSECFFVAIKKEGVLNSLNYYTLEKGISIFGVGEDSVLSMIESTGERVKLGGREYTDLDSFLNEF